MPYCEGAKIADRRLVYAIRPGEHRATGLRRLTITSYRPSSNLPQSTLSLRWVVACPAKVNQENWIRVCDLSEIGCSVAGKATTLTWTQGKFEWVMQMETYSNLRSWSVPREMLRLGKNLPPNLEVKLQPCHLHGSSRPIASENRRTSPRAQLPCSHQLRSSHINAFLTIRNSNKHSYLKTIVSQIRTSQPAKAQTGTIPSYENPSDVGCVLPRFTMNLVY